VTDGDVIPLTDKVQLTSKCKYCDEPIGWKNLKEDSPDEPPEWRPIDATWEIHTCEEYQEASKRRFEQNRAKEEAVRTLPKALNDDQFKAIMLRLDRLEDMLRRGLPGSSLTSAASPLDSAKTREEPPSALERPPEFDEEPF
tara:strand:+ start:955 stop:1380 length:426 start_codon:yes stop_codon:yes gene_type:complete